MAPIPVFTSSPINAAKASGATPQTADSQTPTVTEQTPSTTTATASTASKYTPAQPGAPAVPAPTGSAQKYTPLKPTPTTKKSEDGPPAPQPGALPNPGNIPPPKAGEVFQPQSLPGPPPPTSRPQPYSPQMSIPAPTTTYGSQLPTSSTSISTNPFSSYPVPLPVSDDGSVRRSLEHPPGYQQNSGASEMTGQQQRAQEASNTTSSLSGYDGSLGDTGEEGMWDTAKKWVQSAGEKISEAEAEVWRRINKQ